MLALLVASIFGFAACMFWIVVLLERKAAREQYVPTQREAFYRRSQAWSGSRWDHL